jgi:hypothetical protein
LPTWGELLRELAELRQAAAERPDEFQGQSPHDVLRRRYLRALNERTGRAAIVYATAWLEHKPGMTDDQVAITLGDVQGFMEACSNVEERELDLFLHSPGGSAEAAESIVEYLRTRFDHIRVVVPVAAMSAATMVTLAADEILMGAHSQLGPIDPQFTIFTPEGPRSAPGQAIKDQFDLAKRECQDPANIGAWLPILRSYAPGLLAQCDHQRRLAEEYAARWLERYMFAGDPEATAKAIATASWFSNFGEFLSHGRRVSREDARAQNLNVIDLEADDDLQDAMLSVHHGVAHTLSGTPAAKLIENHKGRAWIQMSQVVQVVQGPGQPGAIPGLPNIVGVPPKQQNPPKRSSSRRKKRGRR